jgi:hypothetical protein
MIPQVRRVYDDPPNKPPPRLLRKGVHVRYVIRRVGSEYRRTCISAGVSGQGKLADELKLGEIRAIIRIFSWTEAVSVCHR